MLPDLKVRQVGPEMAQVVSGVFAASWKAAYRGIISDSYLDGMPEDRWVGFLQDGLTSGEFICLAAVAADRLLGAAVMRGGGLEKLPEHGELSCLYVLSGEMGRGVGSLLLERVLEEMRMRGLKHCALNVLEDNARAIAFYRRRGFTRMDISTKTELGGREYNCTLMCRVL